MKRQKLRKICEDEWTNRQTSGRMNKSYGRVACPWLNYKKKWTIKWEIKKINERFSFSLGLFLLVTMAFLTGHSVARYIHSLAPHTRSAVLCSALLCSLYLLTSITGLLTHFSHSFAIWWDSWNSWICVHSGNAFDGRNAFLVDARNTPSLFLSHAMPKGEFTWQCKTCLWCWFYVNYKEKKEAQRRRT